ncbi:MAG: glycosyltransferase family protein [Candidatus Hodarchaeota archaeon]
MKNIAYYITTHGLGHATRSIAIIRELIKEPKLQISICSKLPLDYLNGCFQSNSIKFHESDTLFGVHYKELLHVDIDKSVDIFKNGIENREKYIKKETEFSKKNHIDLIISDICPFPFDVADKLKIPSIAISNFNWYSIFKHIINEKNSHNLDDNLEILRQSYKKANLLLQLPFSWDMDYFQKKIRCFSSC